MNFKKRLSLNLFPEICQPTAGEIILAGDGSCTNTGDYAGGWSYCVINSSGYYYLTSGSALNTTNNRMELIAILTGLDKIQEYERNRHRLFKKIIIVSDSGYVMFPFIRYNWINKFFKNEISTDTTNYDLWFQLIPLIVRMQDRLEFHHIRGHSNSPTCDNTSKGKNCLSCVSHGCENSLYHYLNAMVDVVSVNARLRLSKG